SRQLELRLDDHHRGQELFPAVGFVQIVLDELVRRQSAVVEIGSCQLDGLGVLAHEAIALERAPRLLDGEAELFILDFKPCQPRRAQRLLLPQLDRLVMRRPADSVVMLDDDLAAVTAQPDTELVRLGPAQTHLPYGFGYFCFTMRTVVFHIPSASLAALRALTRSRLLTFLSS